MKNSDLIAYIFIVILSVMIGWILGMRHGESRARDVEHRAAVAAGVGYYASDPQSGAAEFRYGVQGKEGIGR